MGYQKLAPDIETLFFPTMSGVSFMPSRLIKELAELAGDISSFVPRSVEAALKTKLKAGRA